MSSENTYSLTTVDQVEALIGRPPAPVLRKQIDALDEGCRAVLARSPIAAFGYRDAAGASTTAFVGGRPGFARLLSPTRITFAVPPGAHGPVSLFFLLPGVGEVLRINGSLPSGSDLTAGSGLTACGDLTGNRDVATGSDATAGDVVVTVEEAFVHCAQAVLRSRLWQAPGPAVPLPEVCGDGPLSRPGMSAFLAAAPFLALSTWDGDRGSDTSPRGDQGPVARILDARTLLVADRRGNKRADALHNLMHDDRLSLAALAPGRTDVLHVRGRGRVTTDPALLRTLELGGTPPHAALLIDVEHAELAADAAVAGARLWSPAGHVRPGEAPDLMMLAGEHLAANTAPRFVLTAVRAIPGLDRLLRRVMNRAYRSGLHKEGYADGPLREVRVAGIRRETPTTVTLALEDGRPFEFRPGQFFTLVAEVDGRHVRRAYSASSVPGAARLEVTVKRLEGGAFSTHVHRGLRVGDRLAVRGPSGTFHPRSAADMVLIAAGSGITPMMSMIRTGLADPDGGRIDLLYSSRDEAEIIFGAELDRLGRDHPDRLSVTHVLTRRDGRIDADGIRRWVTGTAPDAHYFVCGPETLTDTARTTLTGMGVPGDRLHSERFQAGPGTVTTEPQRLTVTGAGRLIGTTVVGPGQTLLDAGLAAGLPMPYSCTAGGCGSCTVRLTAGAVTRTEPDGTVLTCVSCPLSAVTLDVTV
ncbi:2Fe-2S iron-sulfur cluster-binding protein [Actinoplanes sp. CA-252034]|uniref:2Fe-2S iron-sulfur cluster-binding protein n=1 Tax=Actinoplanes sp. CA-252034 TaxID=3239906 RepID=UPI003D97C748